MRDINRGHDDGQVRRCLPRADCGVLRQIPRGGVQFGDAARRVTFGAQPDHGVIADLGPIFDGSARTVRALECIQQAVARSKADCAKKCICRRVHGDKTPESVHDDGRIGRVARYRPVHGRAHRRHCRIIERQRGIDGRKPRQMQKAVARMPRQGQHLSQMQQHRARWLRPPGFQKGDMAG